jgi:hypothetical protein
MPKVISGQLSKMTHKADTPIQYFLNFNDQSYSLTPIFWILSYSSKYLTNSSSENSIVFSAAPIWVLVNLTIPASCWDSFFLEYVLSFLTVLIDSSSSSNIKTKAAALLAFLFGLAFHLHASLFLLIPTLLLFFFSPQGPDKDIY